MVGFSPRLTSAMARLAKNPRRARPAAHMVPAMPKPVRITATNRASVTMPRWRRSAKPSVPTSLRPTWCRLTKPNTNAAMPGIPTRTPVIHTLTRSAARRLASCWSKMRSRVSSEVSPGLARPAVAPASPTVQAPPVGPVRAATDCCCSCCRC